jgi:hypothetical protein
MKVRIGIVAWRPDARPTHWRWTMSKKATAREIFVPAAGPAGGSAPPGEIPTPQAAEGADAALTDATRELRRRMIAEAAYFQAERRGFTPGCELEDWLAAEAQVDVGHSRASA